MVMFFDDFGEMAPRNEPQTTILTIRVLQIDATCDDGVRVSAEVEIVLMPVNRGSAVWQLREKLGTENVDAGTSQRLHTIQDDGFLCQVQDFFLDNADSVDHKSWVQASCSGR